MDKPAEKNPPHPPGLQAPGGCFIIYDTGLCVPIPPEPLRLLEAAPKARKDGCLMQKNQNVFLFYVRVLLYCLVALLIRAAALAPGACGSALWRNRSDAPRTSHGAPGKSLPCTTPMQTAIQTIKNSLIVKILVNSKRSEFPPM